MPDLFYVDATIVGYRDVMRALSEYDTNARRQVVNDLRSALRPIVKEAREHVPSPTPMYGWRGVMPKNPRPDVRGGKGWPAWNTNEIKSGIKISFRPSKSRGAGKTRTAVALTSITPSGTIYEFARKSQRHPTFIFNMGATTGGRLLWRAFDRHRGSVDRAVLDAIRNANARLSTAVSRASDRSR